MINPYYLQKLFFLFLLVMQLYLHYSQILETNKTFSLSITQVNVTDMLLQAKEKLWMKIPYLQMSGEVILCFEIPG